MKKNEKKVFGFIWGVYILFLFIISIGCQMYGRPRKHIVDIMEGGKEAFDKRQLIYTAWQ